MAFPIKESNATTATKTAQTSVTRGALTRTAAGNAHLPSVVTASFKHPTETARRKYATHQSIILMAHAPVVTPASCAITTVKVEDSALAYEPTTRIRHAYYRADCRGCCARRWLKSQIAVHC